MFNALKIFLVFSFIRHYKKNIFIIFFFIILTIITIFIANDVLKIVSGSDKFVVLSIKWFLLLLYISIIFYNTSRMFKKKTDPVNYKIDKKKANSYDIKNHNKIHKDRILNGTKGQTKGYMILSKYKKITPDALY